MKRLLLILACLAALSGCAVAPQDPKPSIVVKDHYVVAQIPQADLVIPPAVQPIDVSTATQKTVASWITSHIGREQTLEIQLKNIGQIQQDEIDKAAQQNTQQGN